MSLDHFSLVLVVDRAGQMHSGEGSIPGEVKRHNYITTTGQARENLKSHGLGHLLPQGQNKSCLFAAASRTQIVGVESGHSPD